MSEINEVNIPNVTIPNIVSSESWIYGIPNIPSNHPPVTTNIGFPIVEIPGCVKMHKDNQDKVTRLPFDKDLVNQDEKGSTTLCPHGEYPTYDAMDYTPEQLIIQRETPAPPISPPPEIEPPELPDTGDIGGKEEVACPGPGQLRVGDLTQAGDERVTGHELSVDGKTCITLYEPTTAVEKFLPSANQASTTLAVAVIATAGAAGFYDYQIENSILFEEDWKDACNELGSNLSWLTRRANLLVKGMRSPRITGTTLKIGSVELEVRVETEPCDLMDKQHFGLRAKLENDWRGGVCCSVQKAGNIKIGNDVKILSDS